MRAGLSGRCIVNYFVTLCRLRQCCADWNSSTSVTTEIETEEFGCKWFDKLKATMDTEIDTFIDNLRLGKFETEQEKAEETLALLERTVAEGGWETARELLNLLHSVDAEIQAKMTWETTPSNMVQKVIKIVLDEYNTCCGKAEGSLMSQQAFADFVSEEPPDCTVALPGLRNSILEALLEQKAEIEQCLELIASQGESKIHNDEVILTSGCCETVLSFLLRAAKKRSFQVIVAECAPKYDGHKMAKELAAEKIQTMLIQDAAIFSLMSRVNKVIVGTRTVLSNGGMRTFVGAAFLAACAKFYSVPLYVCCPTYQFSLSTCEELNFYDSPSLLTTPSNSNSNPILNANVAVAKFDYVPPENITSFITNNRGIAPSYVYRQLSELYHPTAYDLV